MSKTSKLAIGVSVASGALLAAWLLTGTRKEKTKKLISKGTATISKKFYNNSDEKLERNGIDDSDVFYI